VLQADLARTFPAFPIYGADAAFEYMPHITIGPGGAGEEPVPGTDPAWQSLPARALARAIEVIVRPPGERWRTRWRVLLRG